MEPDAVLGLERAAWPVLLADSAGVVGYANTAALQAFGAALQDKASRLAAIWSPENPLSSERFLAQWQPSPTPVPLKFRTCDGATLPCLVSICSRTGTEGTCFVLQCFPANGLDAKGRAAGTDNVLLQSQKLDCALQLARTVALDFNNALTSILGHTSLVLSKMEPNHPWRQSLLEVEKSAARAAEIANDLGTFSQQEKETRTQAAGNLNLQVQRCVESLQRNSGAEPQVEWKLQLERHLFAAKFDEAKLQQALLRVLENSVQALRGRGRITIQTRCLELTEATQDCNVQLAAGAYVCVEISDTGCGIAPDVLPRVFEPFFTTKRTPHRGLGLAWVYGIITNHGGGVAISSQPEAGTSVRLYLPAEKRTVRESALPGDDLNGSGQTILLVDDEDLLLTMGQTVLSAYGYKVLIANTGQKALDLLARRKPAVDLVITDLVMPAMSGRELVERIRQMAPETKVLCTSGYVWPAGQEISDDYLQKPFEQPGVARQGKAKPRRELRKPEEGFRGSGSAAEYLNQQRGIADPAESNFGQTSLRPARLRRELSSAFGAARIFSSMLSLMSRR